ncbi:MAG TPA: DUF1810 family protein [Opitutaceae bacterium]|nr:DUF1810 family protein [Opitutaceae bacterium]
MSLERFKQAQADPVSGHATALAELQAGAKRSHWMWYIFPQLRGLGSSAMAVRYGLEGIQEARAYLADPELSEHLRLVTLAVEHSLEKGTPLLALMGSEVDARKLVSSLTLFEALGSDTGQTSSNTRAAEISRLARMILERAECQGISRCRPTLDALNVG